MTGEWVYVLTEKDFATGNTERAQAIPADVFDDMRRAWKARERTAQGRPLAPVIPLRRDSAG